MTACWMEVPEHDTPGAGEEYYLNTRFNYKCTSLINIRAYQVFALCLLHEHNTLNRPFPTFLSFQENACIIQQVIYVMI